MCSTKSTSSSSVTSVRIGWYNRESWRKYRCLTASFGHCTAFLSRVVSPYCIAIRAGSTAASLPSSCVALRESRALLVMKPPHTCFVSSLGAPLSACPRAESSPHSSLRTLAADWPPSFHTATSAHPCALTRLGSMLKSSPLVSGRSSPPSSHSYAVCSPFPAPPPSIFRTILLPATTPQIHDPAGSGILRTESLMLSPWRLALAASATTFVQHSGRLASSSLNSSSSHGAWSPLTLSHLRRLPAGVRRWQTCVIPAAAKRCERSYTSLASLSLSADDRTRLTYSLFALSSLSHSSSSVTAAPHHPFRCGL